MTKELLDEIHETELLRYMFPFDYDPVAISSELAPSIRENVKNIDNELDWLIETEAIDSLLNRFDEETRERVVEHLLNKKDRKLTIELLGECPFIYLTEAMKEAICDDLTLLDYVYPDGYELLDFDFLIDLYKKCEKKGKDVLKCERYKTLLLYFYGAAINTIEYQIDYSKYKLKTYKSPKAILKAVFKRFNMPENVRECFIDNKELIKYIYRTNAPKKTKKRK